MMEVASLVIFCCGSACVLTWHPLGTPVWLQGGSARVRAPSARCRAARPRTSTRRRYAASLR